MCKYIYIYENRALAEFVGDRKKLDNSSRKRLSLCAACKYIHTANDVYATQLLKMMYLFLFCCIIQYKTCTMNVAN